MELESLRPDMHSVFRVKLHDIVQCTSFNYISIILIMNSGIVVEYV